MKNVLARFICLLALCALVSACATSPEQQAKADGDRCTARGWKPGTKEHDDCISRVETERSLRLQQRHRELVEQRAPSYGR